MGIENRIKSLRFENNFTQKELADKIGLTPKMISFYERGERVPPLDIILKLVQIFNVSSDYLLGLSDKRFPDEDLEYRFPHVNNRLGQILRKYCSMKGISGEDFANQLGINSDLFFKIELGTYTPSFKLLKKISEVTNYDIDYLTGAKSSTSIEGDPVEIAGQKYASNLIESDYHFQSRLEEQCLKNNITNDNASELLGLSKQDFLDIKWNRMPTLTELLRISYGLNVSVDYLIGKTDYPNANLTEDEMNLLINYRDCIEPYRKNIRKRAEKLSIESAGKSPVAADEPSQKTGTDNLGKLLPSSGTEGGTRVG